MASGKTDSAQDIYLYDQVTYGDLDSQIEKDLIASGAKIIIVELQERTATKTTSCKKVWSELAKLKKQGIDTQELEDAFCNFECSWLEHAKEYHE